MKLTVSVCLILFTITLFSAARAERTEAREEIWNRAADLAANGTSEIGGAEGVGDDYILIVTGGEDDAIVGTDADEHIRSGWGRDMVFGEGGRDLIDGGPDQDILYGGDGSDHVRGGTGDDEVFGGGGDDLLVGGPGCDLLMGDMGDDIVFGGGGGDEGHYMYDANMFSTDYYDGGPGTDVFKVHVPPEFDHGLADVIVSTFEISPGYFDLGAWGIGLVIVNFESLEIVWEPGARGGGDDEPLGARETTWGGIKTLFR